MRRILGILLFLPLLLFSSGGAVGPVVGPNTVIGWDAVTTNTDGSPATDLKGYRLYWRTATIVPYPVGTPKLELLAPTITAKMSQLNVSQGQGYLVVTAIDTAGNESSVSNELAVFYDSSTPIPPKNLQVVP